MSPAAAPDHVNYSGTNAFSVVAQLRPVIESADKGGYAAGAA